MYQSLLTWIKIPYISYLPPPAFAWCLNELKEEKQREKTSITHVQFRCTTSQSSHSASLMCNLGVRLHRAWPVKRRLISFPSNQESQLRALPPEGDRPIQSSCNKSFGTQPSVTQNRQVMTFHLPLMRESISTMHLSQPVCQTCAKLLLPK